VPRRRREEHGTGDPVGSSARRLPILVAGVVTVTMMLLAVAVMRGDGDEGPPTEKTRGSRTAGSGPTEAASASSASSTNTSTTSPPATTTSAPPATTAPACRPEAAVRAWPLRRRLASLVMVGVDPSGPAGATEAVAGHGVGGVFVGGDDTRLLASGALIALRAASPTGLLVAVDDEGGRVQRLEQLDGDVPSARQMAATMTPAEVTGLARRRARVMIANGVTMDVAPVVDVSDQPDNTVIGDRSWSGDPDVVATFATAYADGLLAERVVPVLKHFPGHGSADGDSHKGAARTPPLDDLRARDLVPYRKMLGPLDGRAAVMLGHLDVPGLTEAGLPSSLSPATVRLLRGDFGFDGVIMTDDLSGMAAVTSRFGANEAAERALAAGVDVVLLGNADLGGLLDHLEAAVAGGGLREEAIDASVVRTMHLKGIDACTVDRGGA